MGWLVAVVGIAGAAVGAAVLLAIVGERAFASRHPAPGAFVPVTGGRLHVVERGAGPIPIVFIHGNPGTALDFEWMQERLASRYRTVAVDRPGFGWSDRPDPSLSPQQQAELIHQAVVALGVERAVVAGFSFGGPVALAYAAAHPENVRALVLLAPVGSPLEGFHMDAGQALLAQPLMGPLLAWATSHTVAPGIVRKQYGTAFAPCPVYPPAVERGSWLFSRPGCLLAAARDWATLEGAFAPLAARYGELRAPVELVIAADDRVVSAPHGEYLRAKLPDVRATVVPGAGHQLMYSHPDVVIAAIERAVTRAAAPAQL